MSRSCLFIVSGLLPSLTWGVTATAAESGGSHRCAGIADDAARLACYDDAFGRTENQVPPAMDREVGAAAPSVGAATPVAGAVTPAIGAATVASQAAARGRDEFGLTDEQIRARDPQNAQETQPSSIQATVTDLGSRPTGELVVTLDSEQVWVQIGTGSTVRLAVGDQVTIRKASLGSFLMITPNRVAVRVRRSR